MFTAAEWAGKNFLWFGHIGVEDVLDELLKSEVEVGLWDTVHGLLFSCIEFISYGMWDIKRLHWSRDITFGVTDCDKKLDLSVKWGIIGHEEGGSCTESAGVMFAIPDSSREQAAGGGHSFSDVAGWSTRRDDYAAYLKTDE